MMDTCWPEKLSLNKERVVKELVQGQEFATQLQILHTTKPYRDDTSLTSSHHQLILKILASFTQALSLITTYDYVDVSQNLATSQVDSGACDDRRSEDSGESRRSPTTTTTKDKRGCYKRKKTFQSWTRVSDIIEDGHAWRKYGQKEILNTKYPRSYFRCTHKYDQGCKATKQVQKMEEDPDVYRTTYIGQHTCRDNILLKFPQIITPHSDNTIVNPHFLSTSNSSKIDPTAHHHPIIEKQEHKEDSPSDLTDTLDSIVWKDFMPFDESTTFPYDYGAAVANSSEVCSTSQSLDMDFVVKSIDFDSEDFHFDESEYLSKP